MNVLYPLLTLRRCASLLLGKLKVIYHQKKLTFIRRSNPMATFLPHVFAPIFAEFKEQDLTDQTIAHHKMKADGAVNTCRFYDNSFHCFQFGAHQWASGTVWVPLKFACSSILLSIIQVGYILYITRHTCTPSTNKAD